MNFTDEKQLRRLVREELARMQSNASSPRIRRATPLQLYCTAMVVVTHQNDHLECTLLADDAIEVLVAKPYLLRRTPFDGLTRDGIEYTYSSASARIADDGDEENQVIVPSYVAGDVIYALRGIEDGVLLTVQSGDDAGADLNWIDMNLDGREWAKQYEELV